jgi:death-on-curing protein
VSEPVFLTIADVEYLHRESISQFGGVHGVRDRGLFESAISQPRHTYHYGGGDHFDIASAYAFHIAEAQACFDGNKRTGVAAALAFLRFNGISIQFESLDLHEAMIAVAKKEMDKSQLAALLRKLCSSA